ncbi:ATP-binding protein [Mesorhizobium sp.]|uniref:ATP-binding protein n=1 Tax=Mesorhizobium sp. TaxID=1871066 RepID=UPI00121BC90B|nr:ATP-binding protein [Mesorhizobium sp.]TIS33921.1 MAG: hypothetical protein E5W95_31985 [Mesorhizobium sp.]
MLDCRPRLKRRRYMNMALLIVDEVGFGPMTREEASLFFRLITYRYGRGAILISPPTKASATGPNCSPATSLAIAILDRLLYRSNVLNIKGRAYRLRNLEEALRIAKRLISPHTPADAMRAPTLTVGTPCLGLLPRHS